MKKEKDRNNICPIILSFSLYDNSLELLFAVYAVITGVTGLTNSNCGRLYRKKKLAGTPICP